jgi:hypothetical protein
MATTHLKGPATLKRSNGAGFPKGRTKPPGSGRKPGGQNLTSRNVREMIIACANGIGGLQRLIEWSMESEVNERIFWSQIWCRLMPVAIQGAGPRGEIEHSLKFSREQVAEELAKRGLPLTVYGFDSPSLSEPKVIEHVPASATADKSVVEERAAATNGADHLLNAKNTKTNGADHRSTTEHSVVAEDGDAQSTVARAAVAEDGDA